MCRVFQFSLLILLLVVIILTRKTTMLAVQTASMVPTFSPGDLLIINNELQGFKVGEVISYRSRMDPREIVSHRIVSIKVVEQQLTTKGDNLTNPDPVIRNWDVLGRVILTIPRTGFALNLLFTWPGLICAIYLPSLVILVIEVRRLCMPRESYYLLQ